MVACSDVLVAIGGGEVTRDELMAGKAAGKPVFFYPAEVSHQHLTQSARKRNEQPPESFWGAAHEVFGKKEYGWWQPGWRHFWIQSGYSTLPGQW
jgi:hypothetical protein